MTRSDLSAVSCSIARTVAVMTDAWSWLIVRDTSVGLGRFEQLHTDLGVSRKVLAQRLAELTAAGVLEQVEYQQHPPRHEYRLTDQGRDLLTVLRAMVAWGDRWRPSGFGAPVRYEHASCPGSSLSEVCDVCTRHVPAAEIVAVAGPGGRTAAGTALIGEYLHPKSRG